MTIAWLGIRQPPTAGLPRSPARLPASATITYTAPCEYGHLAEWTGERYGNTVGATGDRTVVSYVCWACSIQAAVSSDVAVAPC